MNTENAKAKGKFANYLKNEHNAFFFRLCVIFVILLIGISIVKGNMFWTLSNIKSIFLQFPEFGMLGLAFMLAFAAGSTDLSVVGIANLTSVLTAAFMLRFITPETPNGKQAVIIIIACVLAILIGIVCGAFNGFLINQIGIPSIIVTLGTGQLYLGAALAITKGTSFNNVSSLLSYIGNYSLFKLIPTPFIVYVIFAVIIAFQLKATTFGQKLFMTGSSIPAARFSGINTARVNYTAHIWSGVLCAFGGMIMSARTNSANANFGSSYVTLAILVAVFGGADSDGGYGSVLGVTVSLLILQSLMAALNMFPGVSPFYRDLIWGLALIITVVVNAIAKQRQTKGE